VRRGRIQYRRKFDHSSNVRVRLNQRIYMNRIFVTIDQKDRWLQLQAQVSDGFVRSHWLDGSSYEMQRKFAREFVAYKLWRDPGNNIIFHYGSLAFKEMVWLEAIKAGIDIDNYEPSEKRKKELLSKAKKSNPIYFVIICIFIIFVITMRISS
jgi:hypothetical protein